MADNNTVTTTAPIFNASYWAPIYELFDKKLDLDKANPDQIKKIIESLIIKHAAAISNKCKLNDGNLTPIGRFHLIYAYLIENTRIVEIFRRVLHDSRHGESLGVPGDSEGWLFLTEMMFYRDPFPFFPFSIFSFIRPDGGATRRNAYYRMFGMDLNHGSDDGKPYPYQKPEAANREFIATFESFLTEVWIGIENSKNETGINITDDGAIHTLAKRLKDMLTTRRLYASFLHVEFYSICMMLWLHYAVLKQDNSNIVKSLNAQGTSEEERLKKIAERVKLPAHSQAFYFFNLAFPLSNLLVLIEDGLFDGPTEVVQNLYKQGTFFGYDPIKPNKHLVEDMKLIISNWSSATGRTLKERTKPISIGR
jgi:hypothetical protein